MVDLPDVDTRRPEGKPSLHPLPEEPPEDPTDHGWRRGLRDWYWSGIRHELHVFTGGAASYTDQYYDTGYTALEVLEKRARAKALAFPSDEAEEWFRAGLKAASFSFGDDTEILLQGPEGLPDFFLEKALGFVVRRADRALEMYGEETDSVDREVPEVGGGDEEPEEIGSDEPDEPAEATEEAPPEAPKQGSLF